MSEPPDYSPYKFQPSELVNKVSGDYGFPGIVLTCFRTTKGRKRYVVEATGLGYEGMLHIFNEQQLRHQ